MEPAIKKAEQGVYTLLGFAQKSGSLFSGSDMVGQALSKGQVRLVIMADDLSANSAERFWQRWQKTPEKSRRLINIWRFGCKQQLGQAVGKPERGILALGDENFCKGLTAKLQILQSAEPALAQAINYDNI